MSYNIEVTFRGIPDYPQMVSEELWKAAERTRQQWQDNLDQGKGATGSHGRPYVGTGEAIARTTVSPPLPGADEYLIAGETIQHLIAEFGRAPGSKLPPHDVISQWAREQGLQPAEGQTRDDMIWLIRRSIAEHGLKGFAPAQLAVDMISPTVDSNIRARIADIEKQ